MFPYQWMSTKGRFEFEVTAGEEAFEPVRTRIDPTTGTVSTVAKYGEMAVSVTPIACIEDHSAASADGSTCICDAGYYRRDFTSAARGGWSCERCSRGFEPGADGFRCQSCVAGKYSGDGERCTVCTQGYEPNLLASADSCQACDETSHSPDGVVCTHCPPDQVADATRTRCKCPINMYNSSLHGGNLVRCLRQALRGIEQPAPAECVPCVEQECIECGGHTRIRKEFAVAQADQPWLIFKCPFEGTCLQTEAGQRCTTGHTGLLCAVCETGFGLDHDHCVACSATNSSPYAAGGLVALLFVLIGLVYLWRRWHRGEQAKSSPPANFFDELSEQLTTNPLQSQNRTTSSTSSTTTSSNNAVGSMCGSKRELALATAHKSTGLFTVARAVYQHFE